MRLRILPPGLRIREPVGIRCLRTPQAAITLALALQLLAFNNGEQNTATGVAALMLNTIGGINTANGRLRFRVRARATAIQRLAMKDLLSNTIGSENTAVGFNTLRGNTMGDDNTATGTYALSSNTTGIFNIAVGRFAGFNGKHSK